MSRGRRYSGEKKLNMKKVFAVIMALVIIVLFFMVINKLLKEDNKTKDKSFVSAYYTIYENEKWGVIDTKGNVVIAPTYDEIIVIPNNSKDVFVCIEDVNYDTNEYKSKVINKNGKQLYTNYDSVEIIYNNDKNNNLWYETNILKVKKDNKYGLINLSGEEVLPCEYDDIKAAKGTKEVVITVKDNKLGLANNIGSIIIENEYAEISPLTEKYENGFIVKSIENGKYGVIKYDKTVALECKYDEIENVYGNSMYVVKEGKTLKVIDEEETTILENGFTQIKSINSDDIIFEKDGKYGVVNSEGEQKIANTYESLSYAYSNTYIAKKDGKFGIINALEGLKVDFIYNNIKYIENVDIFEAQKDLLESDLLNRNFEIKVSGILSELNTDKRYLKVREQDSYNYYNFKLEKKENTEILTGNTLYLSKKDGKYGYINDKGIVVVDYIYDDATEQNKYGYVSVKKDGKWGALDQKGKEIVPTSYDLSNNLVIDFISKWHLAEDINANYYTK